VWFSKKEKSVTYIALDFTIISRKKKRKSEKENCDVSCRTKTMRK
jgi:hypothetical protein